MKFVIATNNAKKLKELRAILDEFGIEALSLSEAGVESDVEETGETFKENAKLKAISAMQATGLPAIADDSGLSVDAMFGRPGIYSARYGGTACQSDEDRCRFLLNQMKMIPKGSRSARFISAICCTFPDGREIYAQGEIEGEILEEMQGSGGFGYDPLFYVAKENATMAQISQERKNEISHRARAIEKLRKALSEIL